MMLHTFMYTGPLILDESLLSFGWTGIVIVSVTKYPGCHLLHAAVIWQMACAIFWWRICLLFPRGCLIELEPKKEAAELSLLAWPSRRRGCCSESGIIFLLCCQQSSDLFGLFTHSGKRFPKSCQTFHFMSCSLLELPFLQLMIEILYISGS